jgi:predicted 3-demethylubiquinone-9 3-methyltransferase (glyoxalase superfamily)
VPLVQKITPFLWFDGRVEEAAAFYVGIFPDAKIVSANSFTATFVLAGQEFYALNGGPKYPFTEAVSFFVKCADQAEIDYYWSKLIEGGGVESRCGWLKDKFGLSWQIIPDALGRYLSDPDRAKANRVTQAMLQMRKIDVEALGRAFAD